MIELAVVDVQIFKNFPENIALAVAQNQRIALGGAYDKRRSAVVVEPHMRDDRLARIHRRGRKAAPGPFIRKASAKGKPE